MEDRRGQELSVMGMRSNPNRRRNVSASQVRKRKKRNKKARIYARLAVLLSAACLVLFVGVILISTTISAIAGAFGNDKAGKTSADVTNNGQVVQGNASGTNTGETNEGSGGQTENEDGDEPMEGHHASDITLKDELEYGDELYIDGEFVVCIDAGHGGADAGCIGIDGSYEKDDVLKLAQYVEHLLKDKNIKVVMTRDTDKWVTLEDRPAFANGQNADVFISLHRNTYESDESVKGFEAWINSQDSDKSYELAEHIMTGLERVGISKNRGIKKGSQSSASDNYAINAGSKMPSVLLEMGFMSSPTDNQLYDTNIENYAKAIADAIIQWSQGKEY